MISQIVNHINSVIEGMPFFTNVYGMTELKEGQTTQPVYYYDGKYHSIPLADYGFTYWRKRGDVTFTDSPSFISGNNEYISTIPLRLFAITKRKQLPGDDAYSGDRIAGTLIKAITHTGGDLKRQLQARQLLVRSRVYSTNSQQILSAEFAGIELTDFNYKDVVVAIDVDLIITKAAPCYEDVCDYAPRFCLQLENYIALP